MGIFGYFVVAVSVWMLPEMDRMEDAYHELCGGTRQFSYSFGIAGFVSWTSIERSEPPEEILNNLKRTSRYQVLRGILQGNLTNFTRVFEVQDLLGPGWSVEGLSTWSIENF